MAATNATCGKKCEVNKYFNNSLKKKATINVDIRLNYNVQKTLYHQISRIGALLPSLNLKQQAPIQQEHMFINKTQLQIYFMRCISMQAQTSLQKSHDKAMKFLWYPIASTTSDNTLNTSESKESFRKETLHSISTCSWCRPQPSAWWGDPHKATTLQQTTRLGLCNTTATQHVLTATNKQADTLQQTKGKKLCNNTTILTPWNIYKAVTPCNKEQDISANKLSHSGTALSELLLKDALVICSASAATIKIKVIQCVERRE